MSVQQNAFNDFAGGGSQRTYSVKEMPRRRRATAQPQFRAAREMYVQRLTEITHDVKCRTKRI